MGYRVAVVGATGAVGGEMLRILHETGFPADEVFAVASERSAGKEVSYGDDVTLRVRSLPDFDFEGIDLALFSAGASVSGEYAPKAAACGCIVIDNSSRWRMEPDVPLVVPEINPEALEGVRARNIVANPNCSTIQMVMALKPLHDLARITRVVVATYQSVSGAGHRAMEELFEQTRAKFLQEEREPRVFPRPIAFNLIPHIDRFLDDDFTKEEWKMRVETRKILDLEIEVVATCVRVPVFVGHSEAVFVEFAEPVEVEDARGALRAFPGVTVIDRPDRGEYATPVDCVGEYEVFVSRIRRDPTVPSGLALWVVADNLRKGAALNAVQIAHKLVEMGLV